MMLTILCCFMTVKAGAQSLPYIETSSESNAGLWSISNGVSGSDNRVKYKGNTDFPTGSGFSSPCFEVWTANGNGGHLNNGEITHQSMTLPQGTYTVSLEMMGVTDNATSTDPQGAGFTANNKSVRLTTVSSFNENNRTARHGVFTLTDVEVGSDGVLNLKITIDGNITIFWLLFKNLTITSASAPIPTDYTFIPYSGWVYKTENNSDRPNYLKYDTAEPDWQTKADDPRLNDGVKVQRTHEIEHVVWCMPGQTCELTPYTDFTYTDRYRDNYIRWYNYPTGKEDDNLLSFPYPENIITVEGAGYFGGSVLSGQAQNSYPRKFGTTAIFHAPNSNDDILGTIAIEASTQFSYSNNKQINEPTLMFRTIFVIKNAKNRADAMAADNDAYINENRVKLLAPANTAFQYHLPSGEDRKFGKVSSGSGSGGSSEPVDYYLRLNNPSRRNNPWDAQVIYSYGDNNLHTGSYTITFDARTDASNGNNTIAFGYQHDPYNGNQQNHDFTIGNTWTSYTWTFTINDNDINSVYFNCGHLVGNIDFDNVSLRMNGSGSNQINESNGSNNFSNGTTGTTGSWNLRKDEAQDASMSPRSDSSSPSPDADPVHGYYMHLTNSEVGGQKWDAQAVYVLSNALVPGGKYTLTFFAKANESGKSIQFGYQNDNSGHQGFSDDFSLSTYWKQYTWTFTAGSDQGDVKNFFINYGKTDGQIDIDDIVLMYNGNNQISSNASNFNNNALNGWSLKGNNGGKAAINVSNAYTEVIPEPIPTDYWYYDGTEYKQVVHYLIETYSVDIDGNNPTLLGKTINIDGDINTMKANPSLAYTNKVIKGGWGDDYIDDVDRMVFIQNPQAGNYVIKIYALDLSTYTGSRTNISGVQPIKINGTPLELMEYSLEILDPKEGNMITEEDLLDDSKGFSHQRPANMEQMYGKPTTEVNFDEKVPTGEHNGGLYHKWPIQWEMSSYGFTYDKPTSDQLTGEFDYNAYVVANDLKTVTYANASLKSGNSEKNRYDRKYSETNGSEKGYMYYVNAASDPGRMVLLDIGKDFCAGTRVYVSAWVMEANDNRETANVVFSFKGVAADGTETTLSSFVTGYINGGDNTNTGHYSQGHFELDNVAGEPEDDRGKWMHVYYNFYPSIDAGRNFDHYVISLENNATSSSGADYVIDDIRAFVCKPMLNALQEDPVCNGDPATRLKLSTDFDRLLSAIGRKEYKSAPTNPNDSKDQFYYCFIDSATYVNTLKEDGSNYAEAFEAAMVKNVYGYKAGSTTEFAEYGVLNYDRHFESNPTSAAGDLTAFRTTTFTQRTLYFPSNSNVNDTKIKFDRSYWVVMEGSLINKGSGTDVDIPASFDLRDKCTSKNTFEVIFSGEIKVDGMLRSEQDGINICTNQRPVITIDLSGIRTDADTAVVTKDAYFDWYFGPGYAPGTDEDYTEYLDMEEYNGVKLVEALEGFRLRYPKTPAKTKEELMNDSLKTDGATLDPSDPHIVYTDDMRDCIIYYLEEELIALHEKSGIVSSAKYAAILGQGEVRKYYISAVPWNPTPEDKTVRYCLKPIQITLKADTRYPTMKDGNDDPNQVTYPTEIRDVPLRTGLRHLQAASHLEYVDPEDIGAVIPQKPSYLLLPLRDVNPITQGIKKLGLADDVLIYLADSDDPWVNALYEDTNGRIKSKSGAKIVKVYDEKNNYQGQWANTDVKFIGEVLQINAIQGELGSYCKIAFYEDFIFREGYYYTIKFMFNEIYESGYTGAKDAVCPGEVICTIKVVPEYQKWTGAVDSNWNNDKNWSRVTYADLKSENLSDEEKEYMMEFVTDGEIDDVEDLEGNKDDYMNSNEKSFVPAEFTKVIIPADVTNKPIMYDLHHEDNVIGKVKYAGSPVSCYSIKYMTPQEATAASATTTIPSYDEYKDQIGDATKNINYDMASVVITKDNAKTAADLANLNMVACISWFDHTCEQIHFESRAEMLNQQFLQYEKAWADFEIKPGRWYTMSSPITNVVSGDLYLPTATARQESPYFQNIYYDATKNDRFKPAVYQRKWNATDAKLFRLNKNSSATVTQTNAAEGISLDWSHVYNDTNEDFGSGAGFSIKADVTAMPKDDQPEYVQFRLPKADVAYTYFSPGNTDSTYYNQVALPTGFVSNGQRSYRLVDSLTIVNGVDTSFKEVGGYGNNSASKYFLVGNPLMCTVDMAKFLKANEAYLEPKFWLVTEEGQRAAVLDEDVDGFIGSDDGAYEYNYIKPFQSFFVVKKEEATSFTPVFTTDMMHLSSSNDKKNPNEQGFVAPGGNFGAKTRAAETPSGIMRITATDERGLKSAMTITDAAIRHTSGAETLFDSNLADEPMVYSVIDGQAMTIGEIKVGQTVPVGLAGIEGKATITISGIDSFQSTLYLIDALTDETTPLTSSELTLTQEGNGVRYYLATKQMVDADEAISAPVVLANGCHLTVKAPSDANIDRIQIFGTNGMCVAEASNAGLQYDADLVEGIYIIRLVCAGQEYQYKISLH